MTDKEKVYAAMIEAVRNCDPGITCLTCRYRTETNCMEKITADYLIDNDIARKTGKWVFDAFTARFGNPYRCSNCKVEYNDTYNYCPNCGAKMDGERKENEN